MKVPPAADHPGQPPVSTEEFPAGLVLASKALWAGGMMTIDGRPLLPSLVAELNDSGPQADGAVAWRAAVREALATDGVRLVPVGRFHLSPEALDRLDWQEFSTDSPVEGVQGLLQFQSLSEPVRGIESLQGALQLRVAGAADGMKDAIRSSLILHPSSVRAFPTAG